MRADFVEFRYVIRQGIRNGEIKVSKELSDFDLAVQYAAGKIGERKGYPMKTTAAEIWEEINKFAPELLEERGASDDR
jgi:hypothetical protein